MQLADVPPGTELHPGFAGMLARRAAVASANPKVMPHAGAQTLHASVYEARAAGVKRDFSCARDARRKAGREL